MFAHSSIHALMKEVGAWGGEGLQGCVDVDGSLLN